MLLLLRFRGTAAPTFKVGYTVNTNRTVGLTIEPT